MKNIDVRFAANGLLLVKDRDAERLLMERKPWKDAVFTVPIPDDYKISEEAHDWLTKYGTGNEDPGTSSPDTNNDGLKSLKVSTSLDRQLELQFTTKPSWKTK